MMPTTLKGTDQTSRGPLTCSAAMRPGASSTSPSSRSCCAFARPENRPNRPGGQALKVGDVVRLKFGGALMTVSKLFKSPEGREMVQCTWFDKKPREHRAAFVIDSLEAAEQATLRTMQGARLTD